MVWVRNRLLTSVGRATAGSLLASFASQGGTAVSGVLVARMLGVQNRGYLALLILWPTLIGRLGGAGLPIALPYFISRDRAQAITAVRLVVRPAAIQMAILILVHGAVLAVFLPGKPALVQIAGVLTLLAGPLTLASDYLLAVLQGQQRFAAFNVLRSGPASLYCIFAILLFALRISDLFFVTCALIGALLITVVGLLIVVRRGLVKVFPNAGSDFDLGAMFGFGLRGMLGSVSPIETFRLDQAAIGLLLTPAALGLYVVGLAFTNLPRFFAQSIGMVAYPVIASRRADGWSSMWPFVWLTVGLSTGTVLILFAAAPLLVPAIFGTQFSGAVVVTRILLIGSLFFALRRILTDASRGMGRASAGSVAEAASWVWLVPSVILLLPRFGIEGVAMALTTSAAFSFLVLCVIVLNDRPSRQPAIAEASEPVRVAL